MLYKLWCGAIELTFDENLEPVNSVNPEIRYVAASNLTNALAKYTEVVGYGPDNIQLISTESVIS